MWCFVVVQFCALPVGAHWYAVCITFLQIENCCAKNRISVQWCSKYLLRFNIWHKIFVQLNIILGISPQQIEVQQCLQLHPSRQRKELHRQLRPVIWNQILINISISLSMCKCAHVHMCSIFVTQRPT